MTIDHVTEENIAEMPSDGFTEEDYAELVDYYHQECPDVPIELLAKFALIPRSSFICADPSDIIRDLSYPGEKLVLATNVTDNEQWGAAATNIFHQAMDQGIEPASTGCIVGLMALNKGGNFDVFREYYSVLRNLLKLLRKSENDMDGISLDVMSDWDAEESSLTLIFSGIGVRDPLES